jgi:hypothetical protein
MAAGIPAKGSFDDATNKSVIKLLPRKPPAIKERPRDRRGEFGYIKIRGHLRHRLVCRAALEDPERYAGRVIPLSGDELSVGAIIKTFKTVTGRKPWVAPIPTFLAKKMMPKEFLDMFTWIREKGFKANIAEVRQAYPQLLTFAGWVKKYSDEH